MTVMESFKASGVESLAEGLRLRTFFAFFSLKALRGGPRLIYQITICAAILITVTRLLPMKFSNIAFGSNYTTILKWHPSEQEEVSPSGGIRVVAFGGGDIASPNKAPVSSASEEKSWTDILCAEIDGCRTHISYIPQADSKGGSMLSNSVYEESLQRVMTPANDSEPGFDYTWLPEHYAVPSGMLDLEGQVSMFLATPQALHLPRETLWVFDFGYWDIWRLSALPRYAAVDAMNAQLDRLFEQIERIYTKAREEDSIAHSDFYTVLDSTSAPPSENTTAVVLDVPAEPFRVLIPYPFDISLTPGFEGARFKPPQPHSSAVEMRNAAFLAAQWRNLLNAKIDKWIKTPDPAATSSGEAALVERRDALGNQVFVPNARREAITLDNTDYLLNHMIERQMRDAEIQDKTGFGNKPLTEGFTNVWDPCVRVDSVATASANGSLQCLSPQNHLFWTDFTVGSRAVHDIGKKAVERYYKHLENGNQIIARSDEFIPLTFEG
ncbi:hypothetical protein BX600DRAFT_133949 [Xylariales sp. PMI_506]|nr:hypothetical protein BX600DRAFT_133949 [Xylariales sp. PMI_506]